MDAKTVSAFYSMPSFEPRSISAIKEFIENGGNAESIRSVRLSEDISIIEENLRAFEKLGVSAVPYVDRLDSTLLWRWVWANTKDVVGNVVLDATCFTRELLGMLLFALSVRREHLDSVEVQYVSPEPRGYISQNETLTESKRWLSQGVVGIRSIVGYPGNFRSEHSRYVIAFAGHEEDRLWKTLEFLEPDILSMSNEKLDSSTVEGADKLSQYVSDALRARIQLPEFSKITFSAKSIEETYNNLTSHLSECGDKNTTLVLMNTKLSFIGAALAALHNRKVRLVYAVPEEYNPLYSKGAAEVRSFDITDAIKSSATTQVQRPLN